MTELGTVLPGADVAVPAAETRARHGREPDLRARSESAAGRTPPVALTGLPWIEFSLPRPPSVNRFMGKLGNKSPIVRQWIRQADMTLVLARIDRPITKIMNQFECELVFERGPRPYDLDNRIKPLMDWLQRVELIRNDRLCERLECRWGPSNSGVKVRLRPWMTA